MKELLYQLSVIDELVINRATVAELRQHVIAARIEAEKGDKKLKALLRLKAANSLLEGAYSRLQEKHSQLENQHANLQKEHAKLKSSKPKPPMHDKGGFFNPLGV